MNEVKMHQYADGSSAWYLHDELHRDDGPAIEWANGTKMWYLHDELHRDDGPAIERADGSKMWWLHGYWYKNAESWAIALLQQRNKPCDAASVDALLKCILRNQLNESL